MKLDKKSMFEEWDFFRKNIWETALLFQQNDHSCPKSSSINFCLGGLYEIARRNAFELSEGEDWFKESMEEN